MIIDVFPFFNELDLLEIRLNILKGVVDKTILVEAESTFMGNYKALYYDSNLPRYSGFNITHLVVPASEMNKLSDAWAREEYQRNYVMKDLEKIASGNDLILFSDVDEIPRPEIVDNLDECWWGNGILRLEQALHYYYLNGYISSDWDNAVAFRYNKLQEIKDLASMRTVRRDNTITIKEAGWHFSYLGGVQAIQHKMESFSDAEFNTLEFRDASHLEECLRTGKDLYDRVTGVTYIPLNETYPKYILNNQEKYGHLIR
jgi:beta-1,4-mannosyl-glycoprotein beta-1,4-N-acetylglucosaminyltransferase